MRRVLVWETISQQNRGVDREESWHIIAGMVERSSRSMSSELSEARDRVRGVMSSVSDQKNGYVGTLAGVFASKPIQLMSREEIWNDWRKSNWELCPEGNDVLLAKYIVFLRMELLESGVGVYTATRNGFVAHSQVDGEEYLDVVRRERMMRNWPEETKSLKKLWTRLPISKKDGSKLKALSVAQYQFIDAFARVGLGKLISDNELLTLTQRSLETHMLEKSQWLLRDDAVKIRRRMVELDLPFEIVRLRNIGYILDPKKEGDAR